MTPAGVGNLSTLAKSWKNLSDVRSIWSADQASNVVPIRFASKRSFLPRNWSMNVEDQASLYDALSAAKKVARFVQDVDWAAFHSNDEKCSAVYGQLIILGEACTRLSLEVRAQHPDLPWRQIIGMRNRIIHGYDEVNWEIVWEVA